MQKPLAFGLSQKILAVLVFYIGAIMMMAYVSHDDLVATEKKIGVLELSYEIQNNVLEARRHEKNYFLYGNKESLNENLRMMHSTIETCQKIINTDKGFFINPKLHHLINEINLYIQNITSLIKSQDQANISHNETSNTIRQQGKILSELSEHIVTFEKNQIHLMVITLRNQLISWSSVAIFIGIMLSLLIVYLIFKPLSVIKKATEAIAQGKFRKIEVINTWDEI